MQDETYNADDPGFLLSRSLDEDLSARERRRLEELLAESEALRNEARDLRAVDRLVKRWGTESAELDWDYHAALIKGRAADTDDAEGLRELDGLLRLWRRPAASLDDERFVEGVMSRIAPRGSRSSPYGLILRLGRPLAAAAALVFALTAGFWFLLPRERILEVQIGPTVSLRTASDAGSTVLVSFARVPTDPTAAQEAGIAFGAVGASPSLVTPVEDSPL